MNGSPLKVYGLINARTLTVTAHGLKRRPQKSHGLKNAGILKTQGQKRGGSKALKASGTKNAYPIAVFFSFFLVHNTLYIMYTVTQKIDNMGKLFDASAMY